MDLCFSIIHSPYTNLRIRVDETFTVLDFKNLILEKYNLQQKKHCDKTYFCDNNINKIFSEYSNNESLTLFSYFPNFVEFNDMVKIYGKPFVMSNYNTYSNFESANLKLIQNSTNLVDFSDEYGKHHFFVINGHIYERLSKIIYKPMTRGISEAQFTFFSYCDTLRQKVLKKIIKILQFDILRFNEDSSVTIRLTKRMKLNYCIGPNTAQKYYRLLNNGKVSMYKEMENIEHHLSNDICETINEISCNYKFLGECIQCNKRNGFLIGDVECFKCKNIIRKSVV